MNNDKILHYHLSLRLYKDGKFFGPGVATLLSLVDRRGSLRMAAAEMGMAYSKAWRILKAAEAELGFPLLYSRTGGKHGGGAVLTPKCACFLRKYRAFVSEVTAQAEHLFAFYFM